MFFYFFVILSAVEAWRAPPRKATGRAPEAKAELAKQSVTIFGSFLAKGFALLSLTRQYFNIQHSSFNIRHSQFNISIFHINQINPFQSAFQKQTLYKVSILNAINCLTWFKKSTHSNLVETALKPFINV